jgi:hypothetical protein
MFSKMGPTVAACDGMVMMDSFLKECQRLHPPSARMLISPRESLTRLTQNTPNIVSAHRVCISDLKLSNGSSSCNKPRDTQNPADREHVTNRYHTEAGIPRCSPKWNYPAIERELREPRILRRVPVRKACSSRGQRFSIGRPKP